MDRAEKLARRDVDGSAQKEQWDADAQALVDDTIDWEEMISRSYPRDWEELSAKKQKQFMGLMRQLIEASYKSKLKTAFREKNKAKREDLDIEWLEESVKGEKGSLEASVRADQRLVFLKFYVIRHREAWRVWDLKIDGASTVRTYRSQFRNIYKTEGGWDGLITRLEKKLEDVKAGRADITASINRE
ncbi:MAG: ABC transporter substrate-binding protein [Myxococcota bacterium]